MKKKKLEEILEREQKFSHSIYNELRELRKKYYEPISQDEKTKEMAIEFGKFCISMNVEAVGDGKYKTHTGMAPDILTESLEQMYDRLMESKKHS